MWSAMTLRKRIAALLCALLVTVFLATMAGLWIANAEDFAAEREPFERQSAQVTASLKAVLNASNDPDRILNAFVGSLDTSHGAITFQTEQVAQVPPRSVALVPAWFVKLLPLSENRSRSYPVSIGNRTLGYLTFFQDLYADVYEKWLTFLTVIVIFLVVGTGCLVIVYFGLGAMLRPLGELEAGLEGIWRGAMPDTPQDGGPPEIRKLITRTSEIGRTMADLRQENKELLKAMVAIQDRERDEISRDLHDELGPLLFALRANAISLQESSSVEGCRDRAKDMESAIATLQVAHRQILDRLRPMEIKEVGLARSIVHLVERASALDRNLKVDLTVGTGVDDLSEAAARTIYRLVQEALLNIQRHSGATAAQMEIQVQADHGGANELVARIVDNGAGFPQDVVFGRGLRGMAERVRALGGDLTLDTGTAGARIVCRMPAQD